MIIRFKKDSENPYVMVYKGMPEDELLSLKAKGLLLYILTKPDDWQIYIKQLASKLKESTNTIARIIRELRKQGYCHRTKIREVNGILTGYEYNIYEKRREKDPELTKEEQKAENSPKRQNDDTVVSPVHLPKRHNPDTVNDVLLINDLNNNNKRREETHAGTSGSVNGSTHKSVYAEEHDISLNMAEEPAQELSLSDSNKRKESEMEKKELPAKHVPPTEQELPSSFDAEHQSILDRIYTKFGYNWQEPIDYNTRIKTHFYELREAGRYNAEDIYRLTAIGNNYVSARNWVSSFMKYQGIEKEKPIEPRNERVCPECGIQLIDRYRCHKCKWQEVYCNNCNEKITKGEPCPYCGYKEKIVYTCRKCFKKSERIITQCKCGWRDPFENNFKAEREADLKTYNTDTLPAKKEAEKELVTV